MGSLLWAVAPGWIMSWLEPVFDLTCHRLPDRLLMLPWGASGLCSRCTGFWLGGAIGAALLAGRCRSPRSFLPGALLLVPVLVDVALIQLTPYQGATLVRLVTGLLAGGGFANLLYPRDLSSGAPRTKRG
ncbi:DUF2085 domain-containing protein [Candidatus Fermentibacterales bacterium]|nr:DUF2085 domain-containing protein [Candidatus Fermentibacterales bacterium]